MGSSTVELKSKIPFVKASFAAPDVSFLGLLVI